MKTSSPPRPASDLATPLYYQFVYTLTDLLPPPLDDSPQSAARPKPRPPSPRSRRCCRSTPMRPISPPPSRAQSASASPRVPRPRRCCGCSVSTPATSEWAIRIDGRTSLSVHGRLMRVQALRHKREAIDSVANEDAWTLHVAERSMLGAVDPDGGPLNR
jgi:hypothetical protein